MTTIFGLVSNFGWT